ESTGLFDIVKRKTAGPARAEGAFADALSAIAGGSNAQDCEINPGKTTHTCKVWKRSQPRSPVETKPTRSPVETNPTVGLASASVIADRPRNRSGQRGRPPPRPCASTAHAETVRRGGSSAPPGS